MDQDFPRKVTNWGHFFSLILITHWSVEKDDTIMGKVAWGKGKTRVKAGTCINKRRTSFLTLYAAKFGSTATSLFEIWMPAWSSADTARFHRGLFFSFRDRMVLLLSSLNLFLILFFFFTKGSLPLLIFPWAKSFYLWILSSARLRNDMKRAPRWAVAAKIPLGHLPGSEIMTASWFLNFYSKIRFSK